ncbi:MAG: D-alanine--D-alanine ligase family protein [bacterium]|nr:D-alanine--D-alanine ligase family protein [bacterium]
MIDRNKTIGVFFGSRSPEHDVSIITAHLIMGQLRTDGYKVLPVYISKKGEWLLAEKYGTLKTFTDPSLAPSPHEGREGEGYYLDLEKSHGKIVFKRKGFAGKEIRIDIAFPALHGSYGEDGTIQGLFEMLNVPYVGCEVASSAIAMDKVLTKIFCQAKGILTNKFLYFSRQEWNTAQAEILAKIKTELKWPVFVKPPRLGSSIGMTKVKNNLDLKLAIEVALHYDEKFLVEESVENLMDITCCVIGNENPTPSLLQESIFAGSEYFSYEEKYLKEGGAQLGKGGSNVIIPARLDDAITREIREHATNVYKAFGCSGIARVDILYDKSSKKYYVSEINTLPGTLYHHLWKASGVEFSDLLQKLIGYAIQRFDAKQKVAYTFDSDLLRKTNSIKLGSKI